MTDLFFLEKQQTDVLCENNLCGVGTCISLQYGYTCECPAGFIVSQRSSGDAECVGKNKTSSTFNKT